MYSYRQHHSMLKTEWGITSECKWFCTKDNKNLKPVSDFFSQRVKTLIKVLTWNTTTEARLGIWFVLTVAVTRTEKQKYSLHNNMQKSLNNNKKQPLKALAVWSLFVLYTCIYRNMSVILYFRAIYRTQGCLVTAPHVLKQGITQWMLYFLFYGNNINGPVFCSLAI